MRTARVHLRVPIVHAGASAQPLPQKPQSASLDRSVSHPLAGSPSQFAKSGRQLNLHAPAVQTPPTALAAAPHARLHAPQCCALDLVSTSQPLAGLPSQSANPAVQVSRHAPLTHVALATRSPMHERPHIPQFVTVFSCASQPLRPLPSQLPKPSLHVETVQTLVTQLPPIALAKLHGMLQSLQCNDEELVSTHESPQRRLGAVHADSPTHDQVIMSLSYAHTGVAPLQVVPQAPQLVTVPSDSQPLLALPSQLR